MGHKVIDNFLDEVYFNSLTFLICDKDRSRKRGDAPPEFSWYFQSDIEGIDGVPGKLFYMTHMIYEDNKPTSKFYDAMFPLLDKLEVNCLLRIKANLYPRTETVHEHRKHSDKDYPHSGAILYLNTCDGYTKLHDGTKVDSVANRVLLFDPSEEHCSTTTSNEPARFNININYIQEQHV